MDPRRWGVGDIYIYCRSLTSISRLLVDVSSKWVPGNKGPKWNLNRTIDTGGIRQRLNLNADIHIWNSISSRIQFRVAKVSDDSVSLCSEPSSM